MGQSPKKKTFLTPSLIGQFDLIGIFALPIILLATRIIVIIFVIHRFRTVELSSVEPETLTVPIQPDISQFVKDIDFQVKFC